MSASELLGTRRLCLFLFSTISGSRRNAASVLSSSTRSYALLHLLRPFASKTVAESEAETSFSVSYLRNSCGFSLESAKYMSKHVTFDSPERPDSVINLFKEEGFTDAHISKFIRQQPCILISKNLKKRILCKLEFFHSLGCSKTGIVTLFSRKPDLLMMSLEKRIVPCYDIIKSVLLTDSKVVRSFQSDLTYFTFNPASLALNIREMRDRGLPNSCISFALMQHISILFQRPSKFCEILNEVEQMGFDPFKCYFVSAMRVFSIMSKAMVESKLDVLERSGLSRDEAWMIFRKQPLIMGFSEEKIMKVMDFLLNQMRRKSRDIVQYPPVFLCSLEKKTIPRCSVAHVLLSKGLEKEKSLSSLLGPVEEKFVKRYVTSYLGSVPGLLDLYKGKVNLADV